MAHAKRNTKQLSGTHRKACTGLRQINGNHPLRDAVPHGFVDYPVRTRHGGEVFYFNFALAKEMGLIPKNHREVLDSSLRQALLDTFSLKIINEYDIVHKTRIPEKDIRPNKYMATRYLQMQHPDKKGLNSGDGRSIWNGIYVDSRKNKCVTWDISSCGTGATCLSPAASAEGRYIKTGDDTVCYGCGRSDLLDGVGAAINSEIFHLNNIPTERTLAIIAFNDKTSINVRVSRNLLRPAHFFYHLKQNNYQGLKGAIDYYIDRQISNGDWPKPPKGKNRYQYLLERIAIYFAKAAATFESEYIFCWMDWDGDNILADGGVIDFGSVRQFGLCHSEYRYDDVDRYSTSIREQKSKARYIVQTFAQITDFLTNGKKKPIKLFRNDRSLKIFTETLERTKDEAILYKMGFGEKQILSLINDPHSPPAIRSFRNLCAYFERAKSKRGPHRVQDGITWDAIFCLRDVLRELPQCYLSDHASAIAPERFIEIAKSNYATRNDLALTRGRKSKIRQFQTAYRTLVERTAALSRVPMRKVLSTMQCRSALINRFDRVTGDSLIYVSESLIRNRRKLTSTQLHRIVSAFIARQVLRPEFFSGSGITQIKMTNKKTRQLVNSMLKMVEDHREGI